MISQDRLQELSLAKLEMAIWCFLESHGDEGLTMSELRKNFSNHPQKSFAFAVFSLLDDGEIAWFEKDGEIRYIAVVREEV